MSVENFMHGCQLHTKNHRPAGMTLSQECLDVRDLVPASVVSGAALAGRRGLTERCLSRLQATGSEPSGSLAPTARSACHIAAAGVTTPRIHTLRVD
jgi:hypothetical protein